MDSFETFQWSQLARRQKIYIIAAAVLLVGIICYGLVDKFNSWQELRVFEKQKIDAERQAQDALIQAEKIARENVEVKKQLAEKEAEKGGKEKQVEAAKADVARDRLELNRVRREHRGDNPGPEQLCAELAALGYPCS